LDWLYVSVTGAYILLQALALWLLEGGWRAAAWVPAAIMTVAVVAGVSGGLAGSNIAPVWIILAMPGCIGWLVVLLGAWGASRAFGHS
jgi:hypothetical protein